MYVGSALAWDLVGDVVARSFGPHPIQANVAPGMQELEERVAVLLIIHALLGHLGDSGARLQLAFGEPVPAVRLRR